MISKNREEEDSGETQDSRPRSMISRNEIRLNQFNVHLDGEIIDPEEYRDLITLLFTANESDIITMYINCPGGQLDSAMAIIEGMKATRAHVRCIILGSCHSAASMISMYAHEIIVLDAAHSLVHTATFGTIGNSNNIKTHTDFTVKQIEKIIHTTYAGFLTEAELTSVKSGVELWFDADEIRERIERRRKYLETQEKKSVKKSKLK